MPKNPVILIHGYSDEGESFKTWKDVLAENGYDLTSLHTCSYRTLTNEVTIKDIAEAFDRALRLNAGLKPDEPFDAIVHSTGMLVIRAWLTTYPERKKRLKRLIGIAPASFGSPLAHKGRSWLGAIFKGDKNVGPDFLEAGDRVLEGLELASPYTWDLAHKDILSKDVIYGPSGDTPFVFTFCGTKDYGGIKGWITNKPGTDGTVRWAGCALNTRKIKLDFTLDPVKHPERFSFDNWQSDERSNLGNEVILLDGMNHNTILVEPSGELKQLVLKALTIEDNAGYKAWHKEAQAEAASAKRELDAWQQFVVHCTDERGDPVSDYNIQLYRVNSDDGDWEPIEMDVHAFTFDKSYRNFHLNLTKLGLDNLKKLRMEFMASSGSDLVGYMEYLDKAEIENPHVGVNRVIELDLTKLVSEADIKFFYPFTTTLIEVRLNREPLPPLKQNKVAWFLQD